VFPHKLGENAGNLFTQRSADRDRHYVRASKASGARHEISVRYDWYAKQQRAGCHFLNFIRLRELQRLFRSRYGLTLSDDDAGRDDFLLVANQVAHIPGDIEKRVIGLAGRWAPWMSRTEVEELAKTFSERPPLRYTAVKLGELLNLSDVERTRLRITTIRAVGVTLDHMVQRRRTRDRERKRQTRARKRALQPQPLSKLKPWQARGVSRATWYRWRNQDETKCVRSISKNIAADRNCLTSAIAPYQRPML